MKRKVARIGSTTLMISLPSKWAKKYNINKGDELEIKQEQETLIIATEIKSKLMKRKLDLTKIGKFRKNYISHLYQKGYDEVELIFDKREVLEQIRDRVNQLLGFEIIEQGETYCIIKNIAAGLDEEFETILRKIFIMLVDMAESLYDAVDKKEFDRLNEIISLEKMNNKFTNFCLRLLNKKGYSDSTKTHFLYVIIRELEQLADKLRDICHIIILGKNKAIKKEIALLLKDVGHYLRTYYELYYKFDPDKATYMKEKKAEAISKAEQLVSSSKFENLLLMNIIAIFKEAYDLTGPSSCMNL